MNPKSNQLESRLIDFDVDVVKFYQGLPNQKPNLHFRFQLLRSGSSPSLNYGEACMAESRKDFIHKMKICLKELKETSNCLKIISKAGLSENKDSIQSLSKECDELIAIFTKSINTAKMKL